MSNSGRRKRRRGAGEGRKRGPGADGREPEGGAGSGSEDEELKDRLLQTRITPTLHGLVARRARELKIPVSNLVRNILDDSMRLVDNVVVECLNIAVAFSGGRARRPRWAGAPAAPAAEPAGAAEGPVAWQEVVVGRRAECGDCGRPLFPGEAARLGMAADGRPLLFACPDCYAKSIEAARREAVKGAEK
jgi:hypothetical protein